MSVLIDVNQIYSVIGGIRDAPRTISGRVAPEHRRTTSSLPRCGRQGQPIRRPRLRRSPADPVAFRADRGVAHVERAPAPGAFEAPEATHREARSSTDATARPMASPTELVRVKGGEGDFNVPSARPRKHV